MRSPTDVQSEYLSTAYQFVIPETILVAVACALFLQAVVMPRRTLSVVFAILGILGGGVAATLLQSVEIAYFWNLAHGTPLDPRAVSPFDPTAAAVLIRWLVLASGFVLILVALPEITDESAAEFLGCFLILLAGASLVGRANDLVTLFLALEMVSIPTYVLLYLPVRTRATQEAAVKYFLLSVLSSAIFLFGLSYLYGLTGSTNLGAIISCLKEAHQSAVNPLVLVAMVMVILGLGFRITAFPFQFYAPDVYEGGPTGVVAQLAFIPKIVGFAALARLLGLLNPPATELPFDATVTLIPMVLWLLAAATMTFGNVLALLQTNLYRLMAYSGIAHTGYMLVALLIACSLPDAIRSDVTTEPVQAGLESLWYYLVAYGLMTVGTFAVLAALGLSIRSLDDLAGLGQSHPVTAALLAIFLFSLIGLPPTAGFLGKFLIFLAAFEAPTTSPMENLYRILVVVAAVNAAIGAVYYLRILGIMYLRSPLERATPTVHRPALAAALFCAAATVGLGVYPSPVFSIIKQAAPVHDDRPQTPLRGS